MHGSASRWADSLGNPNRPTILDRTAVIERMRRHIVTGVARHLDDVQYAGWCECGCGQQVPVGGSAWYSKGSGLMLAECIERDFELHGRTSSQLSQALNDADREVREAAEAQAEREWHEDRAGDEQ